MIYIQNNNIYYNYIMCNKNKIEKKKKKIYIYIYIYILQMKK